MAICVEAFRPGAVGQLFEYGQRLPLDSPYVQGYPEFWRALVPLDRAK